MILDVFLNHNAKLRHPELAVGTYGYIGVFKGIFSLKKNQVSQVSPTRPERAEAHKAARLKGQKPIKQHALKGQKLLAQGSALGCYGRKVVAL